MTRPDTSSIRLRPDGSIDTAYYMARGRAQRSEAAHRMFRGSPEPEQPQTRGWLRGLLTGGH
ncbi:hypothetical protein [Aestuariicoccus sp. MJ-SS9]|uniref:hypothetical protein n=1 Tax=Aestuariicoccus sp. MJ-SS9 TaxID=3079855 RepID=UPI002907B0DB|nr:hypothetical protein [Aestuariicoccus sp. MJ-SS9]MDU8911538.1 hypothetical protein [Aestuariicoccus sp. MJ-SS9]